MKKGLILVLLLACSCSNGIPFDQTHWLTADLTGRERADMMPDLIRQHGLSGMTRDQVKALLGPPTQTDKWAGAEMIYVLGNDGSYMPIDNEWLIIKLDKQQRVVSFKQVVD